MNNLKIDVFDNHDLIDLIGDLDLAIHFCCCGKVTSSKDLVISTILSKMSKILTKYAPRTDELVVYIKEFSDIIVGDKTNMDVNAMLFLYDCFVHDLRNFVEFATTVGMSKENEHIIYKPTYMGIHQLLSFLTDETPQSGGVEFF